MNKHELLGHAAKALLELALQDPETYHDGYVVALLLKEYEKLGFQPLKEVKENA